MEYTSGLFAIAGALVGGLFTLLAARVGRDWNRARRYIDRLARQVAAFHALEHEYIQALHAADPELGAPRHIQTAMRDRVQEKTGFDRPSMTAKEANRLRDFSRWW